MIAIAAPVGDTLGHAIPPFAPHAISVSLPTWRDFVGYRAGEKRVMGTLLSVYPRMSLLPNVRKLASICEEKFAVNGEKCLLFPSRKVAEHCRTFIIDRAALAGTSTQVRIVQYLVCPKDSSPGTGPCIELHIVLFPPDVFQFGKQFWQDTGLGISSRFTDLCLSLLSGDNKQNPSLHSSPPGSQTLPEYPSVQQPPSESSQPSGAVLPSAMSSKDQNTYLEERYKRDLPLGDAQFAKRIIRRRIAGALVRDNVQDGPQGPCADVQDIEIGPGGKGVQDVNEDDVFLYPTGMAAIWNAHQLCLQARPSAKSVCFGFPYADTLKILQKWGPGVHFFGHGLDSDIDTLESLLAEESSKDPTKPPVVALFTEFPSNPLLRSIDLPRLRALADKYDFLLVVDDTIGNFVNVDVLPYADIIVSSLTKFFSGYANVMGGSLVLNPKGRHYATLKGHMTEYEDTYFGEAAIVMEHNSRKYVQRIRAIDENAQAASAILYSRSAAGGASNAVIKEVFYPKYMTPANYLRCRLPDGGFGGVMSLTFTSLAASKAFFDAMPFHKGPSLGTNFTLACAFTILAHYTELEWAAQYGVEEGLVRISVGMEDKEWLLQSLETALAAAESVKVDETLTS